MTFVKLLFFALLLSFSSVCFCQSALPIAVNLQQTYIKGTRTPEGAPGKNYWQNKADYTLAIKFNPQTRLLTGKAAVDYLNNSPDTLEELHLKLYPNLYRKGNMRNMPVLPEDISDGVNITSLSANQTRITGANMVVTGTDMRVVIPALLPHQSIHLDIDYSYSLNKTSHIRTGQVDSGAFFIAYFFPRIAVYDDIDGWNEHQYLGTQEFYNDFCHFNAAITVPGDYQVWATGNLKNMNEVYAPKIVRRIQEAVVNDNITNVITPADLKNGNITLNRDSNTWKFEADSVPDMAFALSNHYLWQATSLTVDPKTSRRTRVDAVFNPDHKGYFEVINYARKTVEAMSYQFPHWPYPFPHETVFDGLDQMEYPMMVNDAPYEKAEDDIELTDHEIFHSMFPFYMGINETKYAWMDEGWATIGEWIISHIIDNKINDYYAVNTYEATAGHENDLPIMTLSTHLNGVAYTTNSYPKPALGYLYIRDLLGEVAFNRALHYYIAEWHGKHPMPYDFFNCMNTATGMNLNWFWKSWFFDSGVPDLAITKFSSQKSQHTVVITKIGNKPVPIDLTIFYKNGTTELLHKSIACWQTGNKTFTINFNSKKPIDRLVLGNGYDPDVNKKDNVWLVK
jgi:hypothetical protein